MSENRHSASIITFIGPVGVGKTTQIRLVQDYLRSKGIRTVATYIKNSHLLTFLLSRLLRSLGEYEIVYYGSEPKLYPRKEIIRKLFRLWCTLDSISIASKFLLTVFLPFKLGFTVLIEEGPVMTMHVYSVVFPYFFNTRPTILPVVPNLVSWIESRKHSNILLHASSCELDRRRKGRSFRKSELYEYERMQREWIAHLNLGNTCRVDSSGGTVGQIHQRILLALEPQEIALDRLKFQRPS